jgi:NAD(P)-dependent dehydrogenase (short-subunit alcohol dehydrogenase family)
MSENWNHSNIPDQSGRTVLVTGANTGIGFEAAKVLAGKGARVLVGCRDARKAEDAIERIKAGDTKAEVVHLALDLANLASVRAAAEHVLAQETRLNLLINNAGIMAPPRSETADGFESQFGVNHLGHFALTGLLLPLLLKTEGSRVVTVSSNGHKLGKVDFDDLQATKKYSRNGQYCMSKLANLLFTHELQRRLEKRGAPTSAVACHPGVSGTELGRELPSILELLRPLFNRILAQSPADGALPTLRVATDPAVKGGEYYGPSRRFESVGPPVLARSTRASHDEAVAAKLWQRSIELTGVDPGL